MEEKRDIFDLTFMFVLIFVVTGFIFAIPWFFISNQLVRILGVDALRTSFDYIIFYGYYFFETLVLALLVIKYSTDFYLKNAVIAEDQKPMLLRNVSILFLLFVLFPNILSIIVDPITSLIFLTSNFIVFSVIFLYFKQRVI